MTLPDFNLTGDQQQRLVDNQRLIQTLKGHIQRAKLAGLDVSSMEAQLAKAEQLANGLLTQFGTGQPTS